MYDDPKSKINELEKVLDAREDKVSKKIRRHELHDHESNVPQAWDESEFTVSDQEIDNAFGAGAEEKQGPLAMRVLIGSAIFFVLAILIVAYQFIFGGNIVSGDNIEISVRAPVSVAGGETLPLEIEIKNNNSVSLLGADLGVVFPVGAMSVNDVSESAKREQIYIGDIAPGDSVDRNFKVVLFGSENEKKVIKLTLEYKVTGSNSLFNKVKEVTVLVTSAPVSVIVKGPSEINTNQGVSYTVDVISNSNTVIKNLLLKADYPFGFTFGDSSPATYGKNNFWLIGDLAPGEKRTIKISGTVAGQEGEERGFNFSVGTKTAGDTLAIQTPLSSAFSSVTIRRPFVSADLFLNGSASDETVMFAGEKSEVVIRWRNNLPYQVTDASILVKINGNAIDKSSIQLSDGFYRSIDNTIIFDKTTDSTFKSLDPGQSGENKFTLKSFDLSSVTGQTLTSPTIYLDIIVQGKTVDTNGKAEVVSFADSRILKLTARPNVFAKSLYYIGPFQNAGSLPPRAEKETTYTVTWTVTNPLNALSGTRVTAILPTYVTWLGITSPASEKVSYDPNSRQITWSVGNVSAGAGTVSPAREVSFQVSIVPSVSQIGTSPDLVSGATLIARDSFTLSQVSSVSGAVTTTLVNDPYFDVELDTVVK